MMVGQIERIDVMMPIRSEYGVLHHFTEKFYEAFVRAGYTCRLLNGDDCVLVPFKDPPDLTICFNGAPKDELGYFLCDILRVPHVSCLIDPPYRFFDLTFSRFMWLTCDDRFCTQMLHGLNFPRAFFMPHAVESDLKAEAHQERIYDVVMLASFIDYKSRGAEWEKLFPPVIYKAMHQACDVALADEKTSFIWALQQALHPHIWAKNAPIKLEAVTIKKIFEEVELYIKGKDRIELIQSVHDASVHVFGTTIDELEWKEYFRDVQNVIPHPPLSYLEALEVMKQSKIVLNSSIKNKEGAHERIFAGLACGALVVTNENAYVKEQFNEKEGLIFFKRSQFDKINEQINYYLSHEEIRRDEVKKGTEKVMLYHTWDQRVKGLMQSLNLS